jgi:outer membrane protein OmpA-like peptidoglycan-associated protein
MKTIKLLFVVVISFAVTAAMGQGEPADSTKADWHPTAKKTWPSGDDHSLDSGQHLQASGYMDRRAKKWSVGLYGGTTAFAGDADKVQLSWTAGPYVKYSISQTFGLKGEYNFGMLKGSRDNQKPTNFKDDFVFESKFQDWNVQMVFTLGNISFIRPLRKTQMYLFAGVGQGAYKSEANFTDQRLFIGGNYQIDHYLGQGTPNPNLGQDVTEEYEGRHYIFPYGMGLQHNLGENFDIGLEFRATYMRSDDVDVYNTPIWENRVFDSYMLTRLSIEYKFGNKNEQHYDWLSPVQSIYERMDVVENKVDSLTNDIDGDRVSDYWDIDNTTPDSCMVYGNGLAVDTDMDGIPDCQDVEDFSDDNCEVDEFGRMLDDDNDGVPNCRDKEPNTEEGSLVDVNGIAIKNNCCDCEDVNLPTVHFDSDKTYIKPEYYVALYELATKMKQCPDLKITVIGHTDKVGGKKGNEKLSKERSNAIINYMTERYGISRDRFMEEYKGEAEADSKYGYENRRVEFKAAK